MSEKEQEEYKTETGKRPLYFNKPSNDFKRWLEEKIEFENMIDEEPVKITNTKQSNLRGEVIEDRLISNIRKHKRFQKNFENTQKQVKIVDFVKNKDLNTH